MFEPYPSTELIRLANNLLLIEYRILNNTNPNHDGSVANGYLSTTITQIVDWLVQVNVLIGVVLQIPVYM